MDAQRIIIAGASRNPKKFGNIVVRELLEKGFEIIPVNPTGESIEGLKTYRNLLEIDSPCDHLVILTKKTETEKLVEDAIYRNIRNIWIQQQSETPEAIAKAREAGINVITKKCILMYAEPVKGVHTFHRLLVKLFGRYSS